MKRTILLSLTVTAMFAPAVHAQTLTMDRTIEIARDSTIQAFLGSSALMQAKWEHEEFLAGRRPQLFLDLNPGYQKMSFEPATHYYKERNYNMLNTYAEVRLEQKALALGGDFYASTGALWTRYFNQDNPAQLFSTVPLMVGYSNDMISYNPYKWEKELNELKFRISGKEHGHTLRSIALEAVRLYLNCYVAQVRYGICVSNAEVAARLLETGQEKFGMASISKNELSALELQSLNAENALYNARQQKEDTRARLLSYLKIEDMGQETLLEAPAELEYKVIPAEEAIALAKDNNPEYLRTYEQIVSARQLADRAEAQGRLLQTGIDINLGLQSTAVAFGNMYASQQPFMMGSVTLRIPIFDGGLARSRRKAAGYRLEHVEEAEQEAARKLVLDVELALREFNIQQDLLLRTRHALSLADESFELAQELYRNGETDINTFILAQSRKDEAHENYLNSLKGFWESYYTVCLLCDKEF